MNISEAFKQSVRTSVAKGNHARWGEMESATAIADCLDALVENIHAAYQKSMEESEIDEVERGAIREAVRTAMAIDVSIVKAQAKRVVNPSSFAQELEKLASDHPSHIERPKRGERGASKASGDL